MSALRGARQPGVAIAVALLLSAACGAGPSPLPSNDPDVQAAHDDLQKLVTYVESHHAGLFSDMTEAEWRAAVDRLDDMIPELVRHPERLYVEFLRLVAFPGLVGGRHGHMSAEPVEARPVLGIVTYTFADGLYVTRAVAPYEHLVGARITAVAGRPITEVRELVDPLVPRDNEWTPEIWFTAYLRRPEVLAGLGIVDTVGPVELAVELSDGRVETIELGLIDPDDMLALELPSLSWATRDAPEFVLLYVLPERPGALWTSRIEPMWWTTLDDGATLYVQQSLFEPPPASLLAQILEAARAPTVERVILDFRHNLGGDNDGGTLRTFQDAAIDQPGRLFVITSTNVFSATPPVVSALDRTTSAVIVGEPIGGAPLAFAGGSSVRLDRLPIPIEVSVPSGTGGGDDERLTIAPDLLVPLLGPDYFAGRDAALEAILAYQQ